MKRSASAMDKIGTDVPGSSRKRRDSLSPVLVKHEAVTVVPASPGCCCALFHRRPLPVSLNSFYRAMH